jgi:hypothetical protein
MPSTVTSPRRARWTTTGTCLVYLALAPAGAPAAQPAREPTREELLKRVDDLQRRVQALEAQQRRATQRPAAPATTRPSAAPRPAATRPADKPTPNTPAKPARTTAARAAAAANAKAVDDASRAVIRDADRRSKPIPGTSQATAGYDQDGFFIRSGEDFELRPSVFTQFRYVTNSSDESEDDGDYDLQTGFEIRRMRFSIDGTLFTPRLQYGFTWSADRNGGDVSLLDAEVECEFADAWSVALGQYKPPTAHEELTSARRQLAVERSLVNQVLVPGRVQGISLAYGDKPRPLRARVMYHDGANSLNTDFRDPPSNDTNFGVAGRVEYKLFGKWADYRDFTAKGTDKPLLVIGAGTDWTEDGDTDVVLGTLDVQWEHPRGLTTYAALLASHSRTGEEDDDGGNGDDDNRTLDWGGLLQAGYLIDARWEPFARYDVLRLDAGPGRTFHEFTIGVNHYLGDRGQAGHRAKLTADLTYLPEGAPSNETGLGILEAGDDELIMRVQLQLIL